MLAIPAGRSARARHAGRAPPRPTRVLAGWTEGAWRRDHHAIAGATRLCRVSLAARALRRLGDLGVLSEGAFADIILLDLDRMPFVPLNNLKRQLVTVETGSSVVMTIVAGQVVCENGKVLTVDESAIKDEIRAIWRRYRELCDTFNRQPSDLECATREIYNKCAQSDIGLNRWVGG